MYMEWRSLKEMFAALNDSDIEYLVLRNYEVLDDSEFLTDHPDIDLLCNDREKLIQLLGAFPRETERDRIHRAISVDGHTVPVDLRYAGDGYYDPKWEEDMLKSRVMYNDLCYVMSKENCYYSLLYHALIQKREIAPDYRIRLGALRKELDIKEDADIKTLETYMKDKGYRYTYPEFAGAIFNIRNVDKSLIKRDPARMLKRFLHGLGK